MRLSKSRAQQPATKGFGRVFRSPKKRRDSRKSSTQVTYLGQADKLRRAQEVLARLLAEAGAEEADKEEEGEDDCEGRMEVSGDPDNSEMGFTGGEVEGDGDGDSMPDHRMDMDFCPNTPHKSDPIPPSTPIPAKVRCTGPDAEANLLYQQWQALIPRLVSPFLSFVSATHAQKIFPLDRVHSTCLKPNVCVVKTKKVLCLFFDRMCFVFSMAQSYTSFWQILTLSRSIAANVRTS